MSGIISLVTVFHVVAVGQYYYTCYYMVNKFSLPQTDKFRMFNSFGGHYRFLTNWTLITQAVFFTVCVINDILGTNEVSPRKTPLIRKVKDFFHASLGFPLASFVSITFWGLYAVDRELVFPKALDPYFPSWLNHVMHTNVLVFTVVELIISFRVYPKRKNGLLTLSAYMLTYLAWTFVIYFKTDHWVYPVMEVLNWPQRTIFCLALLIFSLILYLVGEYLNKLIWRRVLAQKPSETGDPQSLDTLNPGESGVLSNDADDKAKN